MPTYLPIDPDCLSAAYAQAQAAHPDTKRGWGKAIKSAHEYLMNLWACDTGAAFDGDVLVVESASESGTLHRVGIGTCDCIAGEWAAAQGKKPLCWHRCCRQLLAKMLELQAARDSVQRALAERAEREAQHKAEARRMGERLAEQRRQVYAAVEELYQ